MIDKRDHDLSLLDRPEVLSVLFYPRREMPELHLTPKAMTHFVEVAKNVSIGCRLYPAAKDAPTIMYFHGNGETACDYDYVAPLYTDLGLNLFVTDYRGYGYSSGTPTATSLIQDAHPVFHGCLDCLKGLDYTGSIFIMGRSLGSAPALETALHYQDQAKGLIIESGFSSTMNLIQHLGYGGMFRGIPQIAGFANGDKIRSVAIPTLIIHAQHDHIIPLSEGEDLYRLSGAASKKLVIIPNADHNNLMMVGRERYFEEIKEFVREADWP
jgi:alpha-beta hydrolase superfamily lysophospholipase